MARSSLLGTDRAAREPKGRDAASLGPGDNSDSGSDMMGIADSDDADPGVPADVGLRDDQPHPLQTPEALDASSDAAGTGERRSAGADAGRPDGSDIGVDRVFTPSHKGSDAIADDEDGDLAFLDDAEAGDPLEDESDEDIAEALAPRTSASTPLPGQQPNPQPDVPQPGSVPGEGAGELPDQLPDDDAGDSEHKPGRTAALLRSKP